MTRKIIKNDVWRKQGPCDWVKIARVMFPGNKEYDGGLTGCSVRFSGFSGRYGKVTWFFPATSESKFIKLMKEAGRWLVRKK
ncbi:MAG: hypothetical protein WC551_10735 [Patescibacteria group bacterium]